MSYPAFNPEQLQQLLAAVQGIKRSPDDTTPPAVNPNPFGFNPNPTLSYQPQLPAPPQMQPKQRLMPNFARMSPNLADIRTNPANLQKSQDALANARNAVKKDRPPGYHPVTYGTKDLLWAIPALLAALSGRSGQQFAGSFLSGAFQGKDRANAQYNADQQAAWQFDHQNLIDDYQNADDAYRNEQYNSQSALDQYRSLQIPNGAAPQQVAQQNEPSQPIQASIKNADYRRSAYEQNFDLEQDYAKRTFGANDQQAGMYAIVSTSLSPTLAQFDPRKKGLMKNIDQAFAAFKDLNKMGDQQQQALPMGKKLAYSDALGSAIYSVRQFRDWKLQALDAASKEFRQTNDPSLGRTIDVLAAEAKALDRVEESLVETVNRTRAIFGLRPDGAGQFGYRVGKGLSTAPNVGLSQSPRRH